MSIDCCDYGCSQGRNCPVRTTPLRTHEGGEQVADGLPVAMYLTTRQLLFVLALDVVWWIGTLTLIAIVVAALGFSTGLYRIF